MLQVKNEDKKEWKTKKLNQKLKLSFEINIKFPMAVFSGGPEVGNCQGRNKRSGWIGILSIQKPLQVEEK